MTRSATLLAALCIVLAGCGLGHSSHVLTGEVVAPECDGGYDVEASQITVRNESDEIIGTATTSKDVLGETSSNLCVVRFKIRDVSGAKFYTLKIGSHEGPAWSDKELSKEHYSPTLTLGKAELPRGKKSDVCPELDKIHGVLLNTNALNDDADAWTQQVEAFSPTLEGIADGLLLAGKNAAMASDLDSLGFTVKLFSYDGYSPVKKLNASAAPINTTAAKVANAAGCYWDPVTYS